MPAPLPPSLPLPCPNAQSPVQVHTPAHWCYGDDVYVAPGVADEEAMALLPRGFSEASHYMRTTATPDH